jgi:3-hydroxybutyryl-CoA dehydratase
MSFDPPPRPRACWVLAELKVGQRFCRSYTISEEEAYAFARISGDYNPIHFDEDYARKTPFGARITHGMLSVAKFSGIFGMDLPGLGVVWSSQNVRFLAPVYLDHLYHAFVEVREIYDKAALFATWVESCKGDRVIEGEGVLHPMPQKVRDRLQGDDLGRLVDASHS